MPNARKKREFRGSIAAYAFFAAYIALIGLGAAYHWPDLRLFFIALSVTAMATGSVIVVWRAWRHRRQPGGVRLGQMAALPESWCKWVLGERDDDTPGESSGNPP